MQRSLIFILLFSLSCSVFALERTVDVDWLKKNINHKNLVLIDMSDSLQYQSFHIPGAINLPYEAINTTRKKDRASISIGKQNIVKLLGLLGIERSTHIVIYDDMGGLNAGRLYWELSRIQHPEFSVLNGGLVSWILGHNRVDNKPVKPRPAVYTLPDSVKIESDNYTATTNDVKNAGKDTQIVDVRTPEEYIGSIKHPRTGHIPGAKLWSWDNALDVAGGFRLRQTDSLLKELELQGIDKNKPTIVYCRSGHRASQTFYTLKELGFKDVRLYDGSMKAYSKDKALPLNKGKHP